MLKEQKGITLVALIITIIVMLILAGVSISLVVGENGVMTQAQNAGDSNVKGAVRDAITMANAEMVTSFYSNTSKHGGTTEAITTSTNILTRIQSNYKGYPENTLTISGILPTEPSVTGANPIDNSKELTITIANLKNADENTIKVKCEKVVVGSSHYYTLTEVK